MIWRLSNRPFYPGFLWIGTAILCGANAIKSQPENRNKGSILTIRIENYVGRLLLALDSVTYQNELNQPFTVTKFKYYISAIHLKRSDGKAFISDQFQLVNEEENKSKQWTLSEVSEGIYTELSFTLGVDSLHNCSGLQRGDLDLVNGMFWAWNTGYVFLKLEGKAPQSKSPGHIFEYHIGGFRKPTNCIRTVRLALKELKIESGKQSLLTLKADASEVLKTPTTIDFSRLSSVVDLHNATILANNYNDMFSVLKTE